MYTWWEELDAFRLAASGWRLDGHALTEALR
jgi:exonuclease III